jgi:hypothetical protein
MAVFRHPHLVRGVVHTPQGAFTIVRGLAELPDEIGEALGWPRLGDDRTHAASSGAATANATGPAASVDAILSALKALRRNGGHVAVPECGIDLLMDAGIVARCRACEVSWTVRPSQFRVPGWWACPSGCHQRAAT